jgi:hypothetical protein
MPFETLKVEQRQSEKFALSSLKVQQKIFIFERLSSRPPRLLPASSLIGRKIF